MSCYLVFQPSEQFRGNGGIWDVVNVVKYNVKNKFRLKMQENIETITIIKIE